MIAVKVFAEGVAKQIKEYLPNCYQDADIQVVEKNGNNGVRQTGISICRYGEAMVPLMYMEPFYDEVRAGKGLDEIMKKIARQIGKISQAMLHLEEINRDDFNTAKNYLSVSLINTDANSWVLSRVPHKNIENLSAVCKIGMLRSGESITIDVTNDMIKCWDISENELFDAALENMQKPGNLVLRSMSSIINELLDETPCGEADEIRNLLDQPIMLTGTQKETMCVLTNKERIEGASCILCPNVMKKAGQIFPEGFYIIPSSIHETLLISKEGHWSPKELGALVREVNQTQVGKEDVLSDRIYEYDKEHGKIRQVLESIEKGKELER